MERIEDIEKELYEKGYEVLNLTEDKIIYIKYEDIKQYNGNTNIGHYLRSKIREKAGDIPDANLVWHRWEIEGNYYKFCEGLLNICVAEKKFIKSLILKKQ